MRKTIFLDRDGVINKKAPAHEYVTSVEEFEFLDGSLSAIRKLGDSEYNIVIVTNQRGISRGKMSNKDLVNIHEKMLEEIVSFGGSVDEIYHCPHGYNECDCRKPLPGMINKAREKFDIDLEESWMVGDSESDILLGKAVGCKTIYIGNGNHYNSDFFAKDLASAVDIIIG